MIVFLHSVGGKMEPLANRQVRKERQDDFQIAKGISWRPTSFLGVLDFLAVQKTAPKRKII
jgi:hypothetical protein